MIRNFYVVSVFMVSVATSGCQREIEVSTSPETAPIVTIDQFRDAAKDHAYFWTIGSKDGFHYFRLRQGYCRVAVSEVEAPALQRRIDRGQAEPRIGPGFKFVRSRLHPEMNLIIDGEIEPDVKPNRRVDR